MRKSTTQTVRTEYEDIKFKEGEYVEDFSLRLTNLVQRITVVGDIPEGPLKTGGILLKTRKKQKRNTPLT
jgi:hypothetical protein